MSSDIESLRQEAMKDPLKIQSSVISEFQDRLNEDVALVDPNNTFAFLIESMSRLTANTTQNMERHFEQLYPKRAKTYEDLFKHMSDYDYVGLYATPSQTEMILYFDKDYILDNAKILDDNTRRIVIPEDTFFILGDYTFRMYYPVNIDINRTTENIASYWAPEKENSLYTLTRSVLENREVNYKGIKVLTVKIPVYQFEKTVYTENISNDTGFINVYDYENKFYAIKVWHDPGNTDELDTEMAQTLSGRVYNINEPTAYITVKPEYNKFRIAIPQVYFSKESIGSQVKIEVFTTRGEMNTEINAEEAGNVQVHIPGGNDYANILTTMPLFSVSAGSSRISGGSNGYGFNEMMDRVVNQSFYSRVPVTTQELINYFEDQGFFVERYRDGITDRVYRCYRTLVDDTGNIMLSSGIRTHLSIPDPLPESITLNSDTSYTFLPNRVYKINDQTGHVSFVNTIEKLRENHPTNSKLINYFNNERLVFCPLHTKLWTADRYPIALSYMLTNPSILQTEFVKANDDTPSRVSVFSSTIQADCIGFKNYTASEPGDTKGKYTLNLTVHLQEVENLDNILLFAVIHSEADQYVGNVVTEPNEDGTYSLVLKTDYEILNDDIIIINNFDNSGVFNPQISLTPTIHLYFMMDHGSPAINSGREAIDNDILDLFDYKVSDPNHYQFLNHQKIDVELGRYVTETHNPVEINYDPSELESLNLEYARYSAPVYQRDENGVIVAENTGITSWDFPSDTPTYSLEFDGSGKDAVVTSHNGSNPADIKSGMAVEAVDATSMVDLLYIVSVTESEGVYTLVFNKEPGPGSTTIDGVQIGQPITPLIEFNKLHDIGEWIFDESVMKFDFQILEIGSSDKAGYINAATNADEEVFNTIKKYFNLSKFTLSFYDDGGDIKATVTAPHSEFDNVNDITVGMEVHEKQEINENVRITNIEEVGESTVLTFNTSPVSESGILVTEVQIGEIYKKRPDANVCITSKDADKRFVVPTGTWVETLYKVPDYRLDSPAIDGDGVLTLNTTDGLVSGMYLNSDIYGIPTDTFISSVDSSTEISLSENINLDPEVPEIISGTNVFNLFQFRFNQSITPGTSTGTYADTYIGVPYVKSEYGMPNVDSQYSERTLKYITEMIQIDADYLISDEPEHNNILDKLNDNLNSYFSIVQNIQPNLLEVTKLYFMPLKTIGNANVIVENHQELFTNLEITPRFKLYVNAVTYNSESEQQIVREAIIKIINDYTKKGKFSCSAIARRIEDQLSDRISYVDVVGIKDNYSEYTRPQTLLPVQDNVHPALGNKLELDEQGDIRLTKTLELDFVSTN